MITFPYTEPNDLEACWGDIFVCVAEAVQQARMYRVTWADELARYLVHGVLHLKGYDDQTAKKRKQMKREENRILRVLRSRFNLADLELSKRATA